MKTCFKIILEKVGKKLKKTEKMFLESSRIWCTKIMTWKKYLSSQMRQQKLKSDQEQKQQQQTYVKDPEQECSRSKMNSLHMYQFFWNEKKQLLMNGHVSESDNWEFTKICESNVKLKRKTFKGSRDSGDTHLSLKLQK